MNRNDWLNFINDFLPKNPIGAEIGVYQGYFSKEILERTDMTLYMVDLWRGVDENYEDTTNNNKDYINILEKATENIKGYEDKGIMIRASSQVASNMFLDESLDFIYIDANHAYEFIKQDIELWYPKLRKGGIFSGHDYLNLDWYNDPHFAPNKKDKYIYQVNGFYSGVFGVNPAVDEFCDKHSYKLNKTDEFFGTWWLIK